MKIVLFILLILAAGYVIFCNRAFSEDRVASFLGDFENEINRGNPSAACSKIGDSIQFSIYNKTTFPPLQISGGKRELCEYFVAVSRYNTTAMVADRHYKSDLLVDKSAKSWNQATVSYAEHHEVEFFPSREKIKTISNEQMTLKRNGTGFTVTKWTGETMIEQ